MTDPNKVATVGVLVPAIFDLLKQHTRRTSVAISALVSALVTMLLVQSQNDSMELCHKSLDDIIQRLQTMRAATTVDDMRQTLTNLVDGYVDRDGKVDVKAGN